MMKKLIAILLVIISLFTVSYALAIDIPNVDILKTYEELIKGEWEVNNIHSTFPKGFYSSFKGEDCLLTIGADGNIYITMDIDDAQTTGILAFNSDGTKVVIYREGLAGVYIKK